MSNAYSMDMKPDPEPYYRYLEVMDDYPLIRLRSIEAWQPDMSEEDLAIAVLAGELLVSVRLTSGTMVKFKLLSQEGSRRLLRDTNISVTKQIQYCFEKLGEEWLKS